MSQKITDKNIRFMSEIQSIEKINPLFSKATIRAFYTKSNRNGSYISEEVAERAIPSIYNIPIVGEYIEETDNFSGHGESVEIKNDQITFKSSTVPFGVVPESAKVYWEDVTEDSGVVNKYLVVEGAYLWTGRYEQLNVLKDNKFGQSMEIEVNNGNFAVIDGSEVFKIDEFIFSAFCILGINRDGEGHVEPCFENANITTYSLDKVGFKREFSQMVEELKFSLQQGGNTMPQENVTNEVEEGVETTETETPETEENFDNAETVEQVEEEVVTEVEETVEVDSDNPEQSTEAPETYDEHSSAEVTEDVTESVELTDGQTQAEEVEAVDYEAKFNEATTQLTDLQTTYSTLRTELTELQTYKRQREEADLKAKFEGKLTDEEFETVFAESKEDSLDSIENKLFALIGKKTYSMKTEAKDQTVKVAIASRKDEEPKSPFDALFATYLKK